jgi:tetratricopeptide (TPR) repeat protein/transcriptional regulator with XRE-family HTH domain
VAEAPVTFSSMLRRLRTGVQLTQRELASAANLSVRAVSDLERGIATVPHRDTVRLLADALRLTGPTRADFEAVARGRAAPGAAAATRTLPRDISSFTGRQQELAELVDAASGAGGVVGIHAIGGMAGVGKTAFAVHAAHRLADRFPGGQIFLPLHGHTPGQQPVDPADALVSLLLAAGVAPAQIPPGTEARMAVWRDRLAGRKLLLVLDDAVGSEQVRPLLPGSGASLVLITSRRHLSALEDATAISLDTLPAEEAAGLLVRLAVRPGLGAGDPGVREIARLCGFLPLAIGMVAGQLRHHPAWSAARRAADLAAERDRLELMATENLSVAAAFDLSYADLGPDLQRLFRRLGLHPGTEVDAYAAASLDGIDLAAARRGLEALYDHYLLTEVTQDRYRMHDLIGEHARILAWRLDPDHDREQATARLLDYYQHAAAIAAFLFARQARPGLAAAEGAMPTAVPGLASREEALAWARVERASLVACLDHATGISQHTRVIALTAGLAGLLRRDGTWSEAITRHMAAVRAGQHVGDRLGEANALSDLGDVRQLAGDYPAAAQALEQALDIYRDLGDRQGQANALSDLGAVRRLAGDYPAAAQAEEEALGIYRGLGDRLGEANALRIVGSLRLSTDDFPAAARALEQALAIYRDLGDRQGQANALRILGEVRMSTGDLPAAARALERALAICRNLGDRQGQGAALRALGTVRRLAGDYPAAARADEEALGIFRHIGSRLAQAHVLIELGAVRRATGDYPAAARALEQALSVCRDKGDRLGEAYALSELGAVRGATGDYPAAAQMMEQALGIHRDFGDRYGEAGTLNNKGTLHRVSGELEQAEACYQRALELSRAIANPWDQAHALAGLGRCALAAGHDTQAGSLLGQALEKFQQMGAAETAELLAELDTSSVRRPQHER